MSIYYSILYFFVYGFLGWCTEVIFAAFKQHRFVNRGFLNGPICPIYGVGVTLVIACLEAFQSNLLLLYISSVILVTVLEGVTGWAMDKLFHNKWWDYSKLPFNIGGYVCLLFSLIWGVACVFIVYFVHPLIHQVLSLIPHTAGIALIAILGIALLSDIIVTTSAIVKFNQYLERLKHITDELHAISNQIGSELYQNVMHVLDMQESCRIKNKSPESGRKGSKTGTPSLKGIPETGIQKLQSTAGIVPAKTGTAPWQTLIYPDKNHAAHASPNTMAAVIPIHKNGPKANAVFCPFLFSARSRIQ